MSEEFTNGATASGGLPRPVEAFVLATNSFDLPRLVASFADDAVVNDQFREYRGRHDIGLWADRDIVGHRLTMQVVSVFHLHATTVVEARVDGQFDRHGLPDPLVLSFYFVTHDDEIILLIILRNDPAV